MSHANGQSKHFNSRVLGIDDNFDALELKKSILKEAGCKIVPAANGVAWNMAEAP